MANIFSNATRNVHTNKCIQKSLTELDKKSDAVSLSEAFHEMDRKSQYNAITESAIKMMDEEKRSEITESIVHNSLTDTRIINASNKIYNECRTKLFTAVLNEYFISSLWLDKDFVTENTVTLTQMVSRYVNENGGFGILTEAIDKNPDSVLLHKIYEACDKTAKKVTNRKLTEMKTCEDANNADCKPNAEEKAEFHEDIDKLDVERISELVKDKVITVIQDEKLRQEKEDEVVTDIEDELKKDENVKTEDDVKESLSRIIINPNPFEEATLFNALLRNSYSEIMAENVAIASDVQQQYRDRHNEPNDEVNDNIDDLNDGHDIDNYDEEHVADSVDNEINDDLTLENSVSVNMDNVFADAIANYTLMETLYTLKLENYSYETIRKITQKIVNPVTEASDDVNSESDAFVKVHADFFKIFNKFKNLTDVEKTKEDLKKFVDKCGENEECAHACEIQIATGIAQLKDIIEKNPNLKDKYQDIIDWCTDMGTINETIKEASVSSFFNKSFVRDDLFKG